MGIIIQKCLACGFEERDESIGNWSEDNQLKAFYYTRQRFCPQCGEANWKITYDGRDVTKKVFAFGT